MILAYCGDDESLAAIAAATRDSEVIAVAIDLGQGVFLGELKDRALAAGAVRCHALDLQESFLRDTVLPALAHAVAFGCDDHMLAALARPIVDAAVAEIAPVEKAVAVPTVLQRLPSRAVPRAYATDRAAHIEIRFDKQTPVAVNGVAMSVIEVVESLETIARTSAFTVLTLAYAALASATEPVVTVCVSDGELSIMTPAAVL